MEGEVKGKTFSLKGHTLPGINQRSGGNKSSTFQQNPMMCSMGAAGNIASMQQRDPLAPGVGAPGVGAGMTPPLVSKPSMAKDMISGKYEQKFEK